jgi:hypothetical protein
MSFTIKYSEIGTFAFQQAMQKIVNTPVSVARGVHISQINKTLKKARGKIAEEYMKEVRDPFATKDAEGKLIETEHGFEVQEGKEAEHKAALEAFENRVIEVPVSPLTIGMLEGVKLSAEEIEALGGLILTTPPTPADTVKGLALAQ